MHEAHKAPATRWPPSGHLPQAFKRARPKHSPQYHDYQLPDHLYISLRITSIKAPMPVNSQDRLSVMHSHYDNTHPSSGKVVVSISGDGGCGAGSPPGVTHVW